MGTHGLRVWNSDGKLWLDISDRLTKHLGTIEILTPGQLAITEAVGGLEPWFTILDPANFVTPSNPPFAWKEMVGGVWYIKWDRRSSSTLPFRAVTMIYGIY